MFSILAGPNAILSPPPPRFVGRFWEKFLRGRDKPERLFNMLRQPENEYVEPSDLVGWLNGGALSGRARRSFGEY